VHMSGANKDQTRDATREYHTSDIGLRDVKIIE
jgi:hypothetical protein